tara:strand:+ start:499 stop:915 length:417 start_codon:yes stop_codon:yes gene_type:complete
MKLMINFLGTGDSWQMKAQQDSVYKNFSHALCDSKTSSKPSSKALLDKPINTTPDSPHMNWLSENPNDYNKLAFHYASKYKEAPYTELLERENPKFGILFVNGVTASDIGGSRSELMNFAFPNVKLFAKRLAFALSEE